MPRTATAAVVPEVGGPFALTEVTVDDPRPDEVVVRMVAAGLCHTDLSVRSGVLPGAFPIVLGHEGAGIVEEVGSSVTHVRPGDHVLLSYTSCGACGSCLDGDPAYCVSFLPLNFGPGRADGSPTFTTPAGPVSGLFFGQSAFSTLALVDGRSVVRVGPDAPLDLLAPLGCGVQTGAGAVLNVLRPRSRDTIAVFGAGAVGLAAVMAAALCGVSKVIAVDLLPGRLELAREVGATDVVNAGEGDVAERLRELTGGGVNHVVEASGSVKALSAAIEALALRGSCAIVGAPALGTTVPVDVNGMLGGKRLIGVTEGDANPPTFVPYLADLVTSGKMPLERLVRRFPFADIEKAVAASESGEVIKPILTF